MTSTTTIPQAPFLEQLKYFTKTLPQQCQTPQREDVKKVKTSIMEKEIQKNRKLLARKAAHDQAEEDSEDVKREQEIKAEQQQSRIRKQKAKKQGDSRNPKRQKKITKQPSKPSKPSKFGKSHKPSNKQNGKQKNGGDRPRKQRPQFKK